MCLDQASLSLINSPKCLNKEVRSMMLLFHFFKVILYSVYCIISLFVS